MQASTVVLRSWRVRSVGLELAETRFIASESCACGLLQSQRRREIDAHDIQIAAQRRETAEHQGIMAGNDVVAIAGQIFDDAERLERVHDVRRRKRILL